MNVPNDSTGEVALAKRRDDDGNLFYESRLTPVADGRTKVLHVKSGSVIPIVFIPGIMGSNLKHKKTDVPVWRPPNKGLNLADILGIVAALATWGFRGPRQRQELLRASDLTVDHGGPINVKGAGISRETARTRGWGSVLRDSYNPIMALMQSRLAALMSDGEIGPWWRDEAMAQPTSYGAESELPPLAHDDMRAAAAHDYDVWCAGYNWLQSNRDSAKDVRRYIDDTVLEHYRRQGLVAEKVILVTHSMGGLVARALVELEGYDRILGVIHGVQPATGAPAIYHHMRAGYEGVEQLILGSNAAEVTAVVANSLGALELCPSSDHRDGKPWLFLQNSDGSVACDHEGRPHAYPRDGNPYEEIYKNPSWFGMVPKANERYLNLSDDAEIIEDSARKTFHDNLSLVERFHKEIGGRYHPQTYIHYGADRGMHSWQDIVWRGNIDKFLTPGLLWDDENGAYRSSESDPRQNDLQKVLLTPAEGEGDGTVPAVSGGAAASSGVRASFKHGVSSAGYDHQSSFNDPRARWATLFSIIRIAIAE
ncbi:alpha/beta hydrolase [Cupriavidus sp. AU9028]|uniref:alpha/beta hydrolase n=1 Tax=Cupriavidus sp. AU9028 TaxID=2871157 RepID=UPI0021031178|nr:alpha/beta hydrolase [Cupriavidus sp. AU9028]